jgi:nucleotide-binding universal stress UspA family protein
MIATTTYPNTLRQVEPLHLETSNLEIRNILVATDYSAPAHRALEAAIAIGEVYGAGLLLAHASFSSSFAGGEGVVPAEFLIDQLAEDKKQMEELVANQSALTRLRLDTVVEYADPVTLVKRLVETNKIDLIVVGSQGASGLERLALGSVAESIANNLTVPVLIIGPLARNERELFKSIVFATDLSSTGLRPAQYASSFAERFHSQLLVMHVIEEPLHNISAQLEVEARLLQDMQSLLPKDADLSFYPQFRIEHGRPAERIIETARSVKANLLILGARRQHALADHLPWLTISKVVREAGCGVLVIRNRLV